MIRALAALLTLAAATASLAQQPKLDPAKPLGRVVWGSCNSQDKPQIMWRPILDRKPDLFVIVGDNIYADAKDEATLKAAYAKLGALPDFQELRRTVPVLATWDDHDFGTNDCGSENPIKDASQRLFVDFWGDAPDSPRRKRPGVYDSYIVGPPGKRAQIILLDTRYFRSPHIDLPANQRKTIGSHTQQDGPDAKVLGDAQWAWLKEQLETPAEFRIIASSVQVLSDFHGIEAWIDFPRERERLFALLRETRAEGALFLSGDVHWAELARMQPEGLYPLYDFTSSGLTHVHGGALRSGQRIGKAFTKPNFGEIEFDWSAPDPTMKLTARGQDCAPAFERTIARSELRFPAK